MHEAALKTPVVAPRAAVEARARETCHIVVERRGASTLLASLTSSRSTAAVGRNSAGARSFQSIWSRSACANAWPTPPAQSMAKPNNVIRTIRSNPRRSNASTHGLGMPCLPPMRACSRNSRVRRAVATDTVCRRSPRPRRRSSACGRARGGRGSSRRDRQRARRAPARSLPPSPRPSARRADRAESAPPALTVCAPSLRQRAAMPRPVGRP